MGACGERLVDDKAQNDPEAGQLSPITQTPCLGVVSSVLVCSGAERPRATLFAGSQAAQELHDCAKQPLEEPEHPLRAPEEVHEHVAGAFIRAITTGHTA